KYIPFLRNLLVRRPVIDNNKCIKCGNCVEACPIPKKALKISKGKMRPPVYNYDNCIRCYCCQEMCPKNAIGVKTPFLGRLLICR
ncbi:MAG TPA: 4Fe-4S dicluster domain-containing protein, partial [Euryarchaeota archaeon]|nr:4Fe-4S dicluster domain-containing protein [Euryarchaeota archaeon]